MPKSTTHNSKCTNNSGILQFLSWSISFFSFNCLPDDVLCKIAIWAHSTHHVKSHLTCRSKLREPTSCNLILKIWKYNTRHIWKFRSLSNYILMFVLTFEMNMSNGKMSDFVSFPLFGYTLVKSEKCRFWKSMKYFSKKDMLSNSNMFNGKMSYFVSFPLLAFTLVIKLINFHFEGH